MVRGTAEGSEGDSMRFWRRGVELAVGGGGEEGGDWVAGLEGERGRKGGRGGVGVSEGSGDKGGGKGGEEMKKEKGKTHLVL